MMSSTRPFVAALLGAVAFVSGCNHCEGFNPFRDYKRLPEAGNDDKVPVDVKPGRFHLACHIDRPEDNEYAKRAVEQALRDSGGGSVSELSGAEREKLLATFAQSTGGPYWSPETASGVRLRVGKYSAVFEAPTLNLASDFDVEWTAGPDGQKNPLKLPVNTDASSVTLIHNGGTEYELIFDGAKITERGGLLVSATQDRPRGNRRFEPLPFRLKFGARGEDGFVQAGEEIKLEAKTEAVDILPDPSLLLFEVRDFHGDMSTFLCHLLSRDVDLSEGESDAQPVVVSFSMHETDVWLEADVRGGTLRLRIEATFTVYNAAERAGSLKVEVPGANTISETTDGAASEGGSSLTQSFEGVNLVFKLNYLLEPGKRPEGDYVTFVYQIGNGPESRERVKHSLAGRDE